MYFVLVDLAKAVRISWAKHANSKLDEMTENDF